jgi:hypothetical protein
MFSRATAVRDADGRTREAKIIKQTIDDLVEHVGGRPTAPQKLLIDASVILVLRLRVALDRYATGDGDCESLDRHVVALQNGLRQNLLAIGLQRPTEQAPSLKAYLEGRAEAKRVA